MSFASRTGVLTAAAGFPTQNTLAELRDEVAALERDHARLLADHHRADAVPTGGVLDVDDRSENVLQMDTRSADGFNMDTSDADSRRRAFVRLTQLRAALALENEELERLAAQMASMERQVARLAAEQQRAAALKADADELKRSAPALDVRPLSPAATAAVLRAAVAEIRAFRSSATLSTGRRVFGWRDRHSLTNNTLRFSLEKDFPGHLAEDVSSAVWSVLSSPKGVARAYSRHVDARFHVLQRISEDAVVFYHSLERPGSDARVRALILAARLELEEGTVVLYRGLNPKQLVTRDGPPSTRDRRGRSKLERQTEDEWIDTFVWGLFSQPDGHCRDEFGGVVPATALVAAGWWMLEVLQIALRIETEVFGPVLALSQ